MPTYEYVCPSCGTHIEVVQRFSDEPLTECGVCGGRLRKVFHPAGVLFKGSGFYSTDSRSRGAGSKADGGEGGGAEKGKVAGTPADGGSGGGSGGGAGSEGGPKSGTGSKAKPDAESREKSA